MKPCVRTSPLLILLALTTCSHPNMSTKHSAMTTHTDDIQAITQLANNWRSGWLTGDAALLLSLYADDPVVLPQDQPAIVGKNAIRPLYEAIFNDFTFSSQATIKEIATSGDLAYFWSAYALTATPKTGGDPIHVTGKSLFILKRIAGAWKITRLMDNSDAPAKVPKN